MSITLPRVPAAPVAVAAEVGCAACASGEAHSHHAPLATRPTLIIHSPAGAVQLPASLDRASKRLTRMGFDVTLAEHAKARVQRFAGDEAQRIADLHATARACPDVALASRGGYGLTRILDGIDWKLIAASVDAGVKWVGHSDLTAFQMALLAHTRRPTWMGPMAAFDFGRRKSDLDEITCDCFVEAMTGQLEAIGFKTGKGHDGLDTQGLLWGGNLAVLCSLLGTRHWPRVSGGILVLEDVAEPVYRIERLLLQLHQCGVLAQQSAIVLGDFTDCSTGPMDAGYGLKAVVAYLRSQISTPILTGAPVGHGDLKVTLPVGRSVRLAVQGREAMIHWAD
ncbi:LD-carboxypeptidase [Amphibiibacter pelophylacis]|uniref:LD-carboxypeptidase n=1 Tax=Amphibiibacter pelophylacis TaxID=1799477 RepID=A0ACC6P4L2_9BURK